MSRYGRNWPVHMAYAILALFFLLLAVWFGAGCL